MSLIKQTIEYYKELKKQSAKEKRLLAKEMDYAFLQQIVDKVSLQNVVIDIELSDHTKMTVKPKPKYIETTMAQMFNGDDYGIL